MNAKTEVSTLSPWSETVEARGSTFPLHGSYAPAYRPVVDAFIENFRREDETGSSCSVMKNGKTVVDIWGGFADRERTKSWAQHSTVCMMSVAKGVTAIAFNMLVDRGLIDVDAPVARYWPEFAQNGKAHLKVRWLLDHTAAIPVLTTQPLWPGAMFDREAYVDALAQRRRSGSPAPKRPITYTTWDTCSAR